MSPFLEAPGPRYGPNPQPVVTPRSATPRISSMQWANPNGFLPSSPSQMRLPQFNNAKPNRNKEMSVRVTPRSEKPNTIPMTVQHYVSPKHQPKSTTSKPVKKQPAIVFEPPKNMEKFTAQQIIRQQILNQQQASGLVSNYIMIRINNKYVYIFIKMPKL